MTIIKRFFKKQSKKKIFRQTKAYIRAVQPTYKNFRAKAKIAFQPAYKSLRAKAKIALQPAYKSLRAKAKMTLRPEEPIWQLKKRFLNMAGVRQKKSLSIYGVR